MKKAIIAIIILAIAATAFYVVMQKPFPTQNVVSQDDLEMNKIDPQIPNNMEDFPESNGGPMQQTNGNLDNNSEQNRFDLDLTNATHEIQLTSSGYIPANLTIKKGDRVVWVNISGKDATVNSNDHPTHKKYSFLNLGQFANNESLKVQFNEVGVFGYHDHLNAANEGTITVSE